MGATWTFAIQAFEGQLGKYTISNNGGTNDATFTDTELRDLLGFTADYTGSTAKTGTAQAQGLWLASAGWQSLNDGLSGGYVTDQQVVTNSSGHTYGVTGRKYRKLRVLWPYEQRFKCWTENETTVNGSFETFLKDCIWAGKEWADSTGPIRWHPSASVDATYGTYHALGLSNWEPTELVQHYAGGRWSIELPELVEIP